MLLSWIYTFPKMFNSELQFSLPVSVIISNNALFLRLGKFCFMLSKIPCYMQLKTR